MQKYFTLLTEYFKQAEQKIPTDSFYHGSLEHKYKHSVDVWQIGKQIMSHTPELAAKSAEFKALAERALLFHDVGRFAEAVNLYNDEKKNITVAAANNKYDHGFIGYEILKNQPDFADICILLAIKYHGKMMEQVKKSDLWCEAINAPADIAQAAKEILYLTRDADKLANLQCIKNDNHLEKDNFFMQLSDKALHAPISEKVWAQFSTKEVVFYPDVYSFADRIMLVLSWIYDLNFAYSRDLFFSAGYYDFLLEYLAKYGVSATQIADIKKQVSR